jgi:hypothetical protein
LAGSGARALGGSFKVRAAIAVLPLIVLAELVFWNGAFFKSRDARRYTKANAEVAARLAGRVARMITDPALANPNKAIVYRMRNANGYDAFYPGTAAAWAAEAEGAPAADPSWVLVSRWMSPAAARAGVSARLSTNGINERADAWPLAVFLDDGGERVRPDPTLAIERPERWRAVGHIPKSAVSILLSETRWPGWRAHLDGRAVPLVPWGAAFQSATLTPGSARLDLLFEFVPTRWFLWATLSVVMWGAWLGALMRRAERA